MRVATFDSLTQCLNVFDTKLEKFNGISTTSLPDPMAIAFLKSTVQGNTALLSAWASCDTIQASMSADTISTYDQYFEYLMDQLKQLEITITNNNTSRKANSAESSYLSPYSPSDEQYNDATELFCYMGDRRDVDMGKRGVVDSIHDFLLCSKALKKGSRDRRLVRGVKNRHMKS
mmetsp:Transcript_41757/g.46622  ORF Transcript_41757/g.46622 Transcript_41757/m.46622 type:complete len:175 (+) Transcript_41757:754-1278(+)